jgi:hypothetical protein
MTFRTLPKKDENESEHDDPLHNTPVIYGGWAQVAQLGAYLSAKLRQRL